MVLKHRMQVLCDEPDFEDAFEPVGLGSEGVDIGSVLLLAELGVLVFFSAMIF